MAFYKNCKEEWFEIDDDKNLIVNGKQTGLRHIDFLAPQFNKNYVMISTGDNINHIVARTDGNIILSLIGNNHPSLYGNIIIDINKNPIDIETGQHLLNNFKIIDFYNTETVWIYYYIYIDSKKNMIRINKQSKEVQFNF